MILKISRACVAGGRAVVLCDDDGDPLQNVVSLDLKQNIDDLSTVTATFIIDGKIMRFED